MDGLLINSEDIITTSLNHLLARYGRPPLTPFIRAKLMGVPGSSKGDLFHSFAQLPITREQWARESDAHMRLLFMDCEPLPGAEKLLSNLSRACSASGVTIELGLASSTTSDAFQVKTSRPETKSLLGFFRDERRALGDDLRVRHGRGKPAPDIYLLALALLNSAMDSSQETIKPSECLVFEDSVVGVTAGRRAGMRVIWVPHPELAVEYQAEQKNALSGSPSASALEHEWQIGDIDDGWTEIVPSLEHFDYKKYGISVSP